MTFLHLATEIDEAEACDASLAALMGVSKEHE